MRFADPYLFALLLLIPLALFAKSRLDRSRGAAVYPTLALLADYRATWRIRYRWLPTAVRAAALGLLVIALARPQTGQAESALPGQGIDIVIALDTSSSMQAGFGEGARLEVAQRVIKEFIEGRKEDRIGLVIFRDQSLVLSPLTLDYDALSSVVESVNDVNLADGTAIGSGLGEALNLLRESRARSRITILLTDGENNAGVVEPLAASRIAETLGIRVYTIGIIDAAARRSGNVNVDEEALREMADVTGGQYFPAEDEQALTAIYDNINRLETSRIGRPQFGSYNELAVYFLFAALVLLALELGLQATVWRRVA